MQNFRGLGSSLEAMSKYDQDSGVQRERGQQSGQMRTKYWGDTGEQ